MTIDQPSHTNTRARLEGFRLRQGEPYAAGMIDDGVSQRMLAALVEASGQAQHLAGVIGTGAFRTMEYRATFGQRSGFVDNERVDLAEVLDSAGITEQHTATGRLARRDHDRHRRRQPQGAWAGDDQHRHGIDQAEYPA